MARKKGSRLLRKEEEKNIRQAIIFAFFTLLIALGLIFFGIPILIRAAIFLGTIRDSSTPVETGDQLAPMIPRLKPLPEATNSAKIKLNGFTEGGSNIEVFVNGVSEKKVVAENDGSFTARDINLKDGKNEVTVKATDQAGNSSHPSAPITIYYDNQPPEIEITAPKSTEISGQENKTMISGKTESRVSLTINERVVIVDSQGIFNFPVTLSEGDNQVLIKATDQAGNTTEEEINLSYHP